MPIDQVGCPRPAGGNRHPDFARRARISLRREHCALLVPCENVPDPAAIQRVIQRHDRATGIPEHKVRALGPQAAQNDVGSSKHLLPVP